MGSQARYTMVHFHHHHSISWVPTGLMGNLFGLPRVQTPMGNLRSVSMSSNQPHPPTPCGQLFPCAVLFWDISFLPNYLPRILCRKGEGCHNQCSGLKNPIPGRSGSKTLDSPRACFSPDGRFFACDTGAGDYCLEEHTRRLRDLEYPQTTITIQGFSFSPSGTSILSWGPEGTQLLDHDNHLSSPPRQDWFRSSTYRKHLVAYSEDRTHIVTARQEDSVVTILDTLSGTPQRFN
jgi:hypothetical protein